MLGSVKSYIIIIVDVLSDGKQIGRTDLENGTAFRSLKRAISWLYEFTSKFRCRAIDATILVIVSPSVVVVWS